jgi:RNA-directed DNA polymerase
MQREEKPTMETGLERIAAKARCEPKLRFTSLTHHITKDRIWGNLCEIPTDSAPGVDGQTVPEAKENFEIWIEAMLQSVHRQGYAAPNIRRVYIPKPGKQEKRPLGVPCVADRALQRSAAQVLSAIYEQDFLPCSFGGRPGRGAHQALASLHEVISGRKVEWVLEADLKNFFRELKPRMDAPLCRTSGGRPASDQPDPALAESKHSGRWGDPRERGGHSTRGFDQRIAE